MDKELLKLLPQKAFKLLSFKEVFKVSDKITRSRFDKHSYDIQLQTRITTWPFLDIKIVPTIPTEKPASLTKEDGEKILKIYFSQFFEKSINVHIDLRKSSFFSSDVFYWIPSRFHYKFQDSFLEGVCLLYKGFYYENKNDFEQGLTLLGILNKTIPASQKNEIQELFYNHFGEGKTHSVKFSLKNLQDSFNNIFSYFLKEDIPLNPEFAVLGITLVTLYQTLQDIPYELNVSDVFKEVFENYSPKS